MLEVLLLSGSRGKLGKETSAQLALQPQRGQVTSGVDVVMRLRRTQCLWEERMTWSSCSSSCRTAAPCLSSVLDINQQVPGKNCLDPEDAHGQVVES